MKIGIDGYPLARNYAGIARCVFNLLTEMLGLDEKNEYILYTSKFPLSCLKQKNLSLRISKRFLGKSSTLWMQFAANKSLLKDKIDIFWGTQGILPLNLPAKIKTILTVHDLTWKYYPQTLNWDNRIIFPLFCKKSIEKATRIVAVSETTAQDLKKYSPLAENKICVVYNGGVDTRFLDRPIQKRPEEYLLNKFNISSGYILTVSTIEPRKNIANLLKAFYELKKGKGIDYQLLIVGKRGWKDRAVYELHKRLKFSAQEVKFMGHVSDQDLALLYRQARLFILVSLYEGFGIPPLEAMSCGIPVIVSSIPVFKEILAEAAFFVDPLNYREIAGGIDTVLSNTDLKSRLIRQGFERAKLFSWKNSAEKMLKVIDSIKR